MSWQMYVDYQAFKGVYIHLMIETSHVIIYINQTLSSKLYLYSWIEVTVQCLYYSLLEAQLF